MSPIHEPILPHFLPPWKFETIPDDNFLLIPENLELEKKKKIKTKWHRITKSHIQTTVPSFFK